MRNANLKFAFFLKICSYCLLRLLKKRVHELVKKLTFFSLSFLSKIDREKVFVDVLDRKEAFKDKKNRVL